MTLDRLGRPLRDLRISVTDRCNFRCVYCMPKEVFGRDYRFLDRTELLTFEEIERWRASSSASASTSSGSRAASRSSAADSSALIGAPRADRRRADADDERLAARAEGRRPSPRAGLERVTVSLDSLDDRPSAR